MAYSPEFRDAVAYSLRCVHQESLILKAKQEEHFSICTKVGMCSLGFLLGTGSQLLPLRTTAPQVQLDFVYWVHITQIHGDAYTTVWDEVKLARRTN